MSIEILMPALSPTMTEGNLSKWLINKGDKVNAGDIIAEIETDKATMEIEAVDEGVIEELLFLSIKIFFLLLDFSIVSSFKKLFFNQLKIHSGCVLDPIPDKLAPCSLNKAS